MGDGLALDPACLWSDVTAFQQAVAASDFAGAVTHYRGPLLDGFELDAAPLFERWVDVERMRLAREYGAALEELAQHAESADEWERAAGLWRKLTDHDPHDSRIVVRLMRALVEAGNWPGALEHARAFKRRLRDELDLGPPPELVEFEEQVAARGETPIVARSVPFPRTTRPASAAGPEARESVAVGSADDRSSKTDAGWPRKRFGWPGARRLLGSAIAASILTGLAAAAVVRSGILREPTSVRVAVLPFEALSPDPGSDRYLADGFHDELLSRLGRMPGIRVIARTSVLPYRNAGKRVSEIGRELGDVDGVVEGSFLRDGHRVQLTVRLANARTDERIWGATYDREIDDLFAIQTEITREIAARMGAEVAEPSAGESAPHAAAAPEAYERYLQARALTRRGVDYGGGERRQLFHQAVRLYEEAVELDREFALAHAGLGMQRALNFWLLGERSTDNASRIRASIDRAGELAPDLREVRIARAWEYYFVHRDFAATLRVAEPLEERLGADADLLAVLFTANKRRGRFDEALDLLQRLVTVDPLNSQWAWEESAIYLALRRWPEVERVLKRARSLWPDRPWVYAAEMDLAARSRGDLVRAERAVEKGRKTTGASLLRERLQLAWLRRDYDHGLSLLHELPEPFFEEQDGRFPVQVLRGRWNLASDRVEQARAQFHTAARMLEEILEEQAMVPFRVHEWLALAYAGLGRREEAFRQTRLASEAAAPVALDHWLAPEQDLWRARIAVLVGDHEVALDILERLSAAPVSPLTPAVLRLDPDWDPLRGQPRFRRLVAGSG